ncbi:MAG: sodium/proline symporter [Spirochaetaceae bacterium]|jgi:sodium/proline symporter|nr:sodium/proline symporter [Spirochaetaceae bacterium]
MNIELGKILGGMGIYFVFIIAVALAFVRRSNADAESFFLGRRALGPWVSALSAEASDMSGWLLMGLPGVAYFYGLGMEAFWTAAGLALGTWINWKIVAKRLRTYSETAGNAFTLPSFFSNRFHDRRHILLCISSALIIIFFSIYVGAQFVTFGKLFNYLFNVPHYEKHIIIVGAILVFVYTLLGGFLGESFTDFVQGLLMVLAVVLVFVFGISAAGGFNTMFGKLSDVPRFLDVFGIAEPLADNPGLFGAGRPNSLLNIITCAAWGLGYFGMPQVLLRFMAIKNPARLAQARLIAVTWCVISLFACVGIGLIGRAWEPNLFSTASESELIFLVMAKEFFPPVLAGLVLSGILGASMSSADSYMLITSSSIANDLIKNSFFKNTTEKAVLWIARVTMLAVTIFGLFVALSGSTTIFKIVSYAWAGLGASFGPLILFSLFWRRTTLAGAAAGILTGGASVIIWKHVVAAYGRAHGISALTVYELLPAFIISSIVIVAVSLATPKPSEDIEAEFEKARSLAK